VQQLLLSQLLQPNSPVTLVLPAFQLAPQQIQSVQQTQPVQQRQPLQQTQPLQQNQSMQHLRTGPVTEPESSTGERSSSLQGNISPFVPDCQALKVPRTKAELLAALHQGSVVPFDCDVFAPKQQVGWFGVCACVHRCVVRFPSFAEAAACLPGEEAALQLLCLNTAVCPHCTPGTRACINMHPMVAPMWCATQHP
jgi:hypothetical protein